MTFWFLDLDEAFFTFFCQEGALIFYILGPEVEQHRADSWPRYILAWTRTEYPLPVCPAVSGPASDVGNPFPGISWMKVSISPSSLATLTWELLGLLLWDKAAKGCWKIMGYLGGNLSLLGHDGHEDGGLNEVLCLDSTDSGPSGWYRILLWNVPMGQCGESAWSNWGSGVAPLHLLFGTSFSVL